jgi:TrpR family trp operon transcriptional repressor
MTGVEQVAEVLARIRDPKLVLEFLKCILTPYELGEVSGRWELVKLLDQGVSQRKISEQLGMSLCKITRGSRELKKQNSAFKRVLSEYV